MLCIKRFSPNNFSSAGLAGFFKTDSSLGKQRQEVIRQQNELINASKGVKRSRPEVRLEDEETEARPGLISTDVYSQATGLGRSASSSSSTASIYSSSIAGICFSSSSSRSTERPFRPASSQGAAPPFRKKLKIVVKGFPTTTDDPPPDENSPNNRQTASTTPSAAAAVEEDAQEKAKSYVGLLKKCLTAEEFGMFKQAIKYYKTASDFEALRPVLEAVLVKYQVLQKEILTGFRVFLKKHHLAEFEAFCRREALV